MRSIKYHRPRGLFCNTGKCASCLMRVDGTPNVRACVTPVHDGMQVETQNAFPSARRDFFAIVDKVYRRNFDYHEMLTRPRVLAPLYNGVVRRMAGFGTIPELRPLPARRPSIAKEEVDVLVVGAGPAGLCAAVAAAEGAARVLLVDEGDRAGGSLLLESDVEGQHGARVADELAQRLHDAGGRAMARSVAFGLYTSGAHGDALPPPGLVAVMTPERIHEVRPRALVVASGYHEAPPLIPGNDLPGVMGARAALILLHRHGILPGRRIALTSRTGLAGRAARDLAAAGAEVLPDEGLEIREAYGSDRVKGVVATRAGFEHRLEVDCLLHAGDETPRIELLQQAGVRLRPAGWALAPQAEDVSTNAPGVFVAGSVLGARTLAERMAEGARAGEAAARHARMAVAP